MSDLFNSFWHLCPICGNYVDDGAADGRCFDCLEAAENDYDDSEAPAPD